MCEPNRNNYWYPSILHLIHLEYGIGLRGDMMPQRRQNVAVKGRNQDARLLLPATGRPLWDYPIRHIYKLIPTLRQGTDIMLSTVSP